MIPLEHPEYVNLRNRFFSRKSFYRQGHDPDRIIAVSAYTKSKIVELGRVDLERITVIPCGVTPMSMTAGPEDYLKTVGLAGRRYVLCVGNVAPRKNLGLVVEALSELGASFDDVQMVVAGHKKLSG